MKQVSQGRELVYDAVLYGLGATLGELAKTELGARFAEELHKSVGQRMAEYLKAKGIAYDPGTSPEQSAQRILGVFLEQLGFSPGWRRPSRPSGAAPTGSGGTSSGWRPTPRLRSSTRTRSCPARLTRSSATSWPSRTTPSGSTAAPPTSLRACWSPGRPWWQGRTSLPPRCRPPEAIATGSGPGRRRLRAQDRGRPANREQPGVSSRSCRAARSE